jgi:hypothetical protein
VKRVADELETWPFVFRGDYLHDIKAKRNLGIIQHTQPGESAARDTALLIVPDGFERATKVLSAASFHLDKDEDIVLAANNINFAATFAAKISIQDLVPLLPQESAGEFFTKVAALSGLR